MVGTVYRITFKRPIPDVAMDVAHGTWYEQTFNILIDSTKGSPYDTLMGIVRDRYPKAKLLRIEEITGVDILGDRNV